MISLVEVQVYELDGDPYDDDITKDGIGLIPVGAIGDIAREIEACGWDLLKDILEHVDWRTLYNPALEWRVTQYVVLAFTVIYPPAYFGSDEDAQIKFIGTCDFKQWTAEALHVKPIQN